MSKIGKQPILLPEGVTVTIADNRIDVSGLKGQSFFAIPSGIQIAQAGDKLVVSQIKENDVTTKALFGLTRAVVANLVKGVTTGFEKKLELVGVGFRAQMQGETLVLSLGYAHQVKFTPKAGVKVAVVDNGIVVSGIYKDEVGEAASKIRDIRPPEPYKGKGIKYSGERIRRKAGKAAKAVGGK